MAMTDKEIEIARNVKAVAERNEQLVNLVDQLQSQLRRVEGMSSVHMAAERAMKEQRDYVMRRNCAYRTVLIQILDELQDFDAQCSETEYTDTDDLWKMLNEWKTQLKEVFSDDTE